MPNPLPYKTIRWVGGLDGYIELIDQTLLPSELKIITVSEVKPLWEVIKGLRVRGAPAIGVAAAMGVVLAVRSAGNRQEFFDKLAGVCDYLASARPTAVNLTWALNRMRQKAERLQGLLPQELKDALLAEARAIAAEDAAICRAIGEAGVHLIREGASILTHCNAGALAATEYGTALAPLYLAHERGRKFKVYVDETRPLLQGSRLTAWELFQAGLDVTVICDSMAASLMRERPIDLVITGADRIAANGDTANKIGTYGLAVLAKAQNVPFYVAAPRSTFDLALADGSTIPIEQRPAEEIGCGFGRITAPPKVNFYNPAFDVTPAELIRGLVTESGIIEPPTAESILAMMGGATGGR